MVDYQWVLGPDVMTTLDFLDPGYFYLHNTKSGDLFVVRYYAYELPFIAFFGSEQLRLVNEFMGTDYRWAKVLFPIDGIPVRKDALKERRE